MPPGRPKGDRDSNIERSVNRSPQEQLASFIAKYTPEIGTQARSAVRRMRKRLPGAVILVYDNYTALAIGFGPSERASVRTTGHYRYPPASGE
jgi:hypothetical protein